MNETLALDLVDALQAVDEVSAEATDGYVKIPAEVWGEIMAIYDAILVEGATQK